MFLPVANKLEKTEVQEAAPASVTMVVFQQNIQFKFLFKVAYMQQGPNVYPVGWAEMD